MKTTVIIRDVRENPKFAEPDFQLLLDRCTADDGTKFLAPEDVYTSVANANRYRSTELKADELRPVQFVPLDCDERFLVVHGLWEPAGRPEWDYCNDLPEEEEKRLKKEHEEASRRWFKENRRQLPTSLLDLSSNGDCGAYYFTDREKPMTRAAAMAIAAKGNDETSDAYQDGLIFQRWLMVAELSQEVCGEKLDLNLKGGYGKAESTRFSLVRLVVPTDEERAAHAISWTFNDTDDDGAEEAAEVA